MLVATNGKRIVDSQAKIATKRAEEEVFEYMRTNMWFLYKYQIHWLRASYPKQLGNEFSGSLFGGMKSSSPKDAADLLMLKSGYQYMQVAVPNRKMPITETTVEFKRLTMSFLPEGRPCFISTGGALLFLPELCALKGLSLSEGAKTLIHCISEE